MSGASRHNDNSFAVRLALASGVVYHHVVALTKGYATAFPYVACFLTLSGYLVLHSRVNSRNTGHFLWKRFLRIWPAMIGGGLLFFFFQNPIFVDFVKGTFWYPKPSGYWTITLEETLYLALALLYGLGLYKYKATPWAGLTLSVVVLVAAPHNLSLDWLYFALLVPMFFVGNLLYLYRERIRWNGWIALALLFASLPFMNIHSFYPKYFNFVGQLLIAYPLVYLALYAKPVLAWVERLGDASYSLFLYQWPVMMLIIGFMPNPGFYRLFAATYSCTILLAYLSWHLMEKQALKLKNWQPFAAKVRESAETPNVALQES